MPAGVITVGGKKYAVGLFWQVSDTRALGRAARQAAKQPGSESDYYSLRAGNPAKGRVPQFGLGESRIGHKWNMPSAASALANRQPGSWAGVFMVPEGVWFIEVRDDLIAPEGDQLLADEAEAMSRLQEASARGGLERIYAPPAWAIPGAESSSLPSLLAGRTDGRLQPVTIPRKVLLIGLGVVLVLVLLVGGLLYFLHIKEMERQQEEAQAAQQQIEASRREEEERAKKEEEDRQKQEREQALALPQYQRIWEAMPTAVEWMKSCGEAMEKVVISPLGWEISSAACSGTTLQVSWRRTTGPGMLIEGATMDAGMNGASQTIELPKREPRGKEFLWPPEAFKLYYLYNDLKIDIGELPDEETPTSASGRKLPPPPWKKRRFQMSSEILPWNLKGPLVDFPGLIIHSLTWSAGGVWQIEGVVYEQRK